MDSDSLMENRLNKALIIFACLNILDFISTWFVLYYGGHEANKLMDIAGGNLYILGIYKAFIISMYIFIYKKFLKNVVVQKTNITILGNIILSGVVLFNIYNLCVLLK